MSAKWHVVAPGQGVMPPQVKEAFLAMKITILCAGTVPFDTLPAFFSHGLRLFAFFTSRLLLPLTSIGHSEWILTSALRFKGLLEKHGIEGL